MNFAEIGLRGQVRRCALPPAEVPAFWAALLAHMAHQTPGPTDVRAFYREVWSAEFGADDVAVLVLKKENGEVEATTAFLPRAALRESFRQHAVTLVADFRSLEAPVRAGHVLALLMAMDGDAKSVAAVTVWVPRRAEKEGRPAPKP